MTNDQTHVACGVGNQKITNVCVRNRTRYAKTGGMSLSRLGGGSPSFVLIHKLCNLGTDKGDEALFFQFNFKASVKDAPTTHV
jgi:hypothetical protein